VKKFLLVLVAAITMAACTPSTQSDTLQRYSNQTVEGGFDTIITIIAYTKTQQEFNKYYEMMRDEFYRYHQLYDKYNSYEGIQNIYTINQQAGIAPVTVDQSIIDLLLLSKEWYEKSNGLFDATLGAVLKVWHNYREQGLIDNQNGKEATIPDMATLEEAKKCTGWEFVEIDEVAKTVYLTDACASLDVGGVAKGYATELVAQKLAAEGLDKAVINAGGNVRTIGNKVNDEPWAVGIESPDMGLSDSLDTIRLPKTGSFVTSGDYQRFFVGPGGVTYHHLIDPNTLLPGRNMRSVTIIMEDSGLADIVSTILFLATYEEGVELIESLQNQFPDQVIGAIWVFNQGQAPANSQFRSSGGYSIVISPSLTSYSRIFAS